MRIKQGDLYPPLRIDTNADITGATAVAKLRKVHGTTVLTKTLTISGDPTEGVFEYTWQAGDTDTVGTYKVEALVTFAGGAVQRFPQGSDLELIIRPKVG